MEDGVKGINVDGKNKIQKFKNICLTYIEEKITFSFNSQLIAHPSHFPD